MRGLAIMGGLSCAFVAQAIAFFMTGAGHGWVAPFTFSALLWIAYPVALLRWVDRPSRTFWIEALLIVVAVAADLRLHDNIVDAEARYFSVTMYIAPFWGGLWLLLWCAWQPLVAVTFARRFIDLLRD